MHEQSAFSRSPVRSAVRPVGKVQADGSCCRDAVNARQVRPRGGVAAGLQEKCQVRWANLVTVCHRAGIVSKRCRPRNR